MSAHSTRGRRQAVCPKQKKVRPRWKLSHVMITSGGVQTTTVQAMSFERLLCAMLLYLFLQGKGELNVLTGVWHLGSAQEMLSDILCKQIARFISQL